MLIVCWAAKGGSGTTVTAASMALSQPVPTLLVDLAGDIPLVIGAGDAQRPGALDWLAAEAPTRRLARLEQSITPDLTIIPAGTGDGVIAPSRWWQMAEHLAADARRVIVDAGTGEPPPALLERATAALLVTRACYVSVTRACAQAARPTGVVLLAEPGRALHELDVERSIGAPIVATVLLDPKIARAADAGLATSRLPRACVKQLQAVA